MPKPRHQTTAPDESPRKSGVRGMWPVYLLLGAYLVGMMYGRNLSGDVWWHLKTGQWIVQHRALPFIDPFSYTAHNPVTLHEWGAEVVEWLLYSLSPSALAWGSVLIIAVAFGLAFRMAVQRSKSRLASFLVIAVGVSASAASAEMRPQVFSFLFIALTVMLLERYHNDRSPAVWLIVPLMLLWVNFHGIFLIGIGIVALDAVVGLVSPPEWARTKPNPRLAAGGTLLGVTAAATLVSLVNPNGLAPFTYPLHVLTHPDATRWTAEWTPPKFSEWTGISLLLLIGLVITGVVSARRRVKLRDVAYVLVFAALALMSQRHAPIFTLTCAAPIAAWLACTEDRIAAWLARFGLDRAGSRAAWAMLGALVLVLFVWRVSDARGRTAFDYMNQSEMFPAAACDYIEGSNLSGPMFNDYNYGGYLIWRLWPKHRVFVDSRQEPFFGGAYEESMEAITCGKPDYWEQVFRKYSISFAVLHPQSPLAVVLSNRPDWSLVYADDKADVLIRNKR